MKKIIVAINDTLPTKENEMKLRLSSLAGLALIIIQAACGTTQQYSGPVMPEKDVAKISAGGPWINPIFWGPRSVSLRTINDRRVSGSVTVLPGWQQIVFEVDSDSLTRNKVYTLPLEARAGKSYNVRAQNVGVGAFGLGGIMYTWIEDEEGKIVSGTPPPGRPSQ